MIYKITRATDWRTAEAVGTFLGSKDDLRDGFIHFSSADQLPGTAEKYFSNVHDLVLIAVDERSLADLKWEPSRGGALFPHLYASLPTAAAVWVRPLPLRADGVPDIPTGLS